MRCLPEVIPEPVGTGLIPASFANAASAVDAFGVVAGDDEDLRGGVDADAELAQQVRCPLHDELFDHGHEFLDLLIEGKPAFRDRTQCVGSNRLGFEAHGVATLRSDGRASAASSGRSQCGVVPGRARSSL
jgi:hypothetical protein